MEKQIKVTFKNSVKRESDIISGETTVKDAIKQAPITMDNGTISLDGMILTDAQQALPLSALVHGDECTLYSIVKLDNANVL